jgi:hypothetical protein
MKPALALTLLSLVLACATRAPDRESEPRYRKAAEETEPEPRYKKAEIEVDELEAAKRELARDERALAGISAQDQPVDCERATKLGENICALAERICVLVQRLPPDPQRTDCPDARKRCLAARERVQARCKR